MIEKIAGWARTVFWIVAIAAVIYAAWKITGRTGGLVINQGAVTWNTVSPIKPGDVIDQKWVVGELNKYRTNAMWITNRKGKIDFGLYDRRGSAEYSFADEQKRHEVGVLFGHDFGIYYQYSILDSWSVGGHIVIDGNDKNLKAIGSIGKKF